MKILCPNCSEAVKLTELEEAGEQGGYCIKCKTVINATYGDTKGGSKVWHIRFEKLPEPKKKEPEKKGGCLTLLLILAVIVAIALYRVWGDLDLKIININGP
jgi:hypothetical protein